MSSVRRICTRLKSFLSPRLLSKAASGTTIAIGIAGFGFSYKAYQRRKEFEKNIAPYYQSSYIFAPVLGTYYESSLVKQPGLNTELRGILRLFNPNGTYCELGGLFTESWREFLDQCPEDVTLSLTLAHRQAFGKRPIWKRVNSFVGGEGLRHPLFYISDGKEMHALFGFLLPDPKRGRHHAIINEIINMNVVSCAYTLHSERKMTFNKKEARLFFEEMEHYSKNQTYTGFSFNCGTPLAKALVTRNTVKRGGQTDREMAWKKIGVVVPLCRLNFGYGTLFNNQIWSELNATHLMLSTFRRGSF